MKGIFNFESKIFSLGHLLTIQIMVTKENERIRPPIQREGIISSIPRSLETPKPAITVTVQIGHILFNTVS